MNKKERELIYNMFGGKCAYCGCELKKGWHADHKECLHRDSIYNKEKMRFEQTGTCAHPENERMDNYFPSCASCNITKATFSIEQFRQYITDTVVSLNGNNYAAYKFAKRYGLIEETGINVKFYFETINQPPS